MFREKLKIMKETENLEAMAGAGGQLEVINTIVNFIFGFGVITFLF